MKNWMMSAVLTALLVATPAVAKKEVEQVVKADTLEAFQKVADSVREQMKSGGHYEYIKITDKNIVDHELDQMAALLQKSGSVEAMNKDDKLVLFNLQEKVNGTLANNASDRLLCERTNPVGSHIPVTTCQTYAELMRRNSESKKYMQDSARMHQPKGPPEGGGRSN